MKRLFVILIFGMILQFQSNGQKAIENLQAPSSPAAAVIGIQPSVVLSPKSYEALETSIFSNYFNGQGQVLIPNNLAIEYTPYWTKDHPMSVDDYLRPSIGQSLLRNLSISVASTQNFVIQDTVKSNALGFGIRTTIYLSGQEYKNEIDQSLKNVRDVAALASNTLTDAVTILTSKELKNNDEFVNFLIDGLKKNDVYLKQFKNQTNAKLSDLSKYVRKKLPDLPGETPLNNTSKEFVAYADTLNAIIDEFFKISEIHESIIENLIKLRPGFKIDIAFASFLNFPSNDFNFSISPQQSFWITPSYRFKNNLSFIEILGVLRYNWYNLGYYQQYFQKNETFENNLDYGVSLNLNFKKVTFHIEAVGRYSKTILSQSSDSTGIITTKSKSVSDFQCLGTFSYHISKKLCLSYSFGKQFQPMLNYNGTLISSLSLNLGFGGPTTDKIYK